MRPARSSYNFCWRTSISSESYTPSKEAVVCPPLLPVAVLTEVVSEIYPQDHELQDVVGGLHKLTQPPPNVHLYRYPYSRTPEEGQKTGEGETFARTFRTCAFPPTTGKF